MIREHPSRQREDQMLSLMPLCTKLAREKAYRWSYLGAEFEDLLSLAHEGAWTAVCDYEPTHGATLTTFAYMRIREAIIKWIRHEMRDKRRGRNLSSSLDLLKEEIGFEVSFDDADLVLGSAVEERDVVRALREALSTLPIRERRVLDAVIIEARTMREVGIDLGLTEGRICQIKNGVLKKLETTIRRKESA